MLFLGSLSFLFLPACAPLVSLVAHGAARCVSRRRPASPVAGFTLLEVMIALAVLAVALPILLQLTASGVDQVGEARFLVQAAGLAEERLTALTTTAEPITDTTGDFAPPFADYSWRLATTAVHEPAWLPAGFQLVSYRLEVWDRRDPGRRYGLVRHRLEGDSL